MFLSALRAAGQPDIAQGRGTVFGLGHGQQAAGDHIGDVGDHAGDHVVPVVSGDQLHQKFGYPCGDLCQFVHRLRARSGGDKAGGIGGLKAGQVGLRDDAHQRIAGHDGQVAQPVLHHQVQHVRADGGGAKDAGVWCHHIAHGGLMGQAFGQRLARKIAQGDDAGQGASGDNAKAGNMAIPHQGCGLLHGHGGVAGGGIGDHQRLDLNMAEIGCGLRSIVARAVKEPANIRIGVAQVVEDVWRNADQAAVGVGLCGGCGTAIAQESTLAKGVPAAQQGQLVSGSVTDGDFAVLDDVETAQCFTEAVDVLTGGDIDLYDLVQQRIKRALRQRIIGGEVGKEGSGGGGHLSVPHLCRWCDYAPPAEAGPAE